MLGDAQEPDAVPARPDVRHPAQVAGQRGIVPAIGPRMAVRLEHQPGEERGRPDRRPAPDEDAEDGPLRRRDPQLHEASTYPGTPQASRFRGRAPPALPGALPAPRLLNPLTGAHEAPIILPWPSAPSLLTRRTRRLPTCVLWQSRWSGRSVRSTRHRSRATTLPAASPGTAAASRLPSSPRFTSSSSSGQPSSPRSSTSSMSWGCRSRTSTQASSTFPRSATASGCSSAGGSARTRLRSGTVSRTVSRVGSLPLPAAEPASVCAVPPLPLGSEPPAGQSPAPAAVRHGPSGTFVPAGTQR